MAFGMPNISTELITQKKEGTRKTTMQLTPLPFQHQTLLPQCTFLHTPHT